MKEDQNVPLTGVVYSFGLGKKPRSWTILNLRFGAVKRLFVVRPYDHQTGGGWQRTHSRAHMRSLRQAMVADDYTPAPWSGSILPGHDAKYHEDDKGLKTVTVTVQPKKPLACLDGNHRWGALDIEYNAAEKAGDTARMADIDSQWVTVILYLDPKLVQPDFMRLQLGKAMDKNTVRSMLQRNKMLGPLQPFADLATEVCQTLNRDNQSHLFGQIKFDTRGGQGGINYGSLVTEKSSELGTTIFGGAKIALAAKKDARWLAATYVEAWRAVNEMTERDAGGEDAAVLGRDMMLCPYLREGTRGASHFIVGIGNMLAWRKSFAGKDKASEEDLRRVAAVVDAEFRRDGSGVGWSSVDKRRELGLFAEAYFDDVVLRPGEPPAPKKTGGYNGVPVPLVNLLSPGTFLIDRGVIDAVAQGDAPTPDDEFGPQADIAEEAEGAPKKAPKKTRISTKAVTIRGVQS